MCSALVGKLLCAFFFIIIIIINLFNFLMPSFTEGMASNLDTVPQLHHNLGLLSNRMGNYLNKVDMGQAPQIVNMVLGGECPRGADLAWQPCHGPVEGPPQAWET